MSLRAGNMQQISGWALRCGIRSPHRASQQASVARQWGWMLPAMLMLAMPVSAAISAPERNEPQGWQWYNEPQDNTEPQASHWSPRAAAPQPGQLPSTKRSVSVLQHVSQ